MGADPVGLRHGLPTCDTCGAVFRDHPHLWAGDACLRCGDGVILEVFDAEPRSKRARLLAAVRAAMKELR